MNMMQIAKSPSKAQFLTAGDSLPSMALFILPFGKIKNNEATRKGSPNRISALNTCSAQLEAEKLNMRAWLYDEDRWPSGAAGGLVTKNKEFRIRYLIPVEIEPGG